MNNSKLAAFPLPRAIDDINPYSGLDKREFYTATALQGLISNRSLFPGDLAPHDITRAARLAVKLADATLAALEPEPTPTQKF